MRSLLCLFKPLLISSHFAGRHSLFLILALPTQSLLAMNVAGYTYLSGYQPFVGYTDHNALTVVGKQADKPLLMGANPISARDTTPSLLPSRRPSKSSYSLFSSPNINSGTILRSNHMDTRTNYSVLNANSVAHPFELPDLGNGGERFIEVNQHIALGQWSLQRLNGSVNRLQDAWSQQQLENMAWRINAQTRSQAPLALVVVNNPAINAFAIPGGVMGINTGTIMAASSLDEVASVVAHEVAHLSQRHYEHRGDASKKALLLQIGGVLAAIAASSLDGDAAAAVMMGSQTAALNSQMAFSRSNEREADRIGMQMMVKSGYNPKAMPRFFATLNERSQLNSNQQGYLPSFVMSHPLSTERLSDAQSRAAQYPDIGFENVQNAAVFDLMKWRIQVLTQQTSEAELLAAAPHSRGALLALAYWYGSQGLENQAKAAFNRLHHLTTQSDTEFDILLAVTEAQVTKDPQAAADLLMPYYHLYPERQDLRLYLSDIWLKQGKYAEVLAALKPLLNARPRDLQVIMSLQQAYELQAKQLNKAHGNSTQNNDKQEVQSQLATIHALRYRSKAELWQGQYNDALISLQQAKKIAKLPLADINAFSRKSVATHIPLVKNTIDFKPLEAVINAEIKAVKTAKDFEP